MSGLLMCVLRTKQPARMAVGERTISTDEMTGLQALERAAPGLPLRPGKVEGASSIHPPRHAVVDSDFDVAPAR